MYYSFRRLISVSIVLSPFFRTNVAVSFKSVESVCNQARRAALPKGAKTVQEIIDAFEKDFIRETYGFTYRPNINDTKSAFFKHAYECAEFAFCVFSSDDIVKAIEQNVEVSQRRLYSDATFKIVPVGIFKQLLIVFCELLGYVRLKHLNLLTLFRVFFCNYFVFEYNIWLLSGRAICIYPNDK